MTRLICELYLKVFYDDDWDYDYQVMIEGEYKDCLVDREETSWIKGKRLPLIEYFRLKGLGEL